mgnify:CR=1 FL=1
MGNNLIYSSIISTRAQKEMAVSWDWYEERLKGLGDKFVKEVIDRISNIQQSPDRYNKRKKLVWIVSVFHTSRNPKKKY